MKRSNIPVLQGGCQCDQIRYETAGSNPNIFRGWCKFIKKFGQLTFCQLCFDNPDWCEGTAENTPRVFGSETQKFSIIPADFPTFENCVLLYNGAELEHVIYDEHRII